VGTRGSVDVGTEGDGGESVGTGGEVVGTGGEVVGTGGEVGGTGGEDGGTSGGGVGVDRGILVVEGTGSGGGLVTVGGPGFSEVDG
jgi:hypothetical protein